MYIWILKRKKIKILVDLCSFSIFQISTSYTVHFFFFFSSLERKRQNINCARSLGLKCGKRPILLSAKSASNAERSEVCFFFHIPGLNFLFGSFFFFSFSHWIEEDKDEFQPWNMEKKQASYVTLRSHLKSVHEKSRNILRIINIHQLSTNDYRSTVRNLFLDYLDYA